MAKLKEPKGMDECSFFTRRVLEKDKTKLVAWVPKDTMIVNVVYTCGTCKKSGEITQPYEKPISFSCQNCGNLIVVEPIKGKARGRKKAKRT